jgi:predicted GNAT family N-acyltransferase
LVRESANDQELQEALALRKEVFIIEQHRERKEDFDAYDKLATHMVATKYGEVIGTLRIYRLHPDDTDLKIGRVAVRQDWRGRGIGKELMEAAVQSAENKCRSVYLHAQISVIGFYEKMGFVTEGDVFDESGTPHVIMRKKSDASTNIGS